MEEKNITVSVHPDYKTEIIQLIQSNLTPKHLQARLSEYHENDIAAALPALQREERGKLYSILDTETLANVLEYTDDLSQYMAEISLRKQIPILTHMETSATVSYLAEIEKEERNTLLDFMPEEIKREIALLASFDKDEIGSKMTTNYISVTVGTDVRGAMNALVSQAADNDNVSTIYVVDEGNTFVGAIDLKDLIRARAGTPLDDIIMTSFPYVYTDETIDDCLERIRGYSEDSIPVLNGENKLCGVLTAQELAQVVEEEIGDDYAKLGGLSAEEDLREPLFRSIGKRLPWLIILLGLGLIVSGVVGLFDHVVSHLTLIVSFQSLILDMAGNVGTQSLAVTIRSLTDENLSGKQKAFLVWKEARVGFLNGLILGLLSFVLIGAYLSVFRGETLTLAFSVSLCTGIALSVSMLLSGVAGTVIPLFFKKIKVDPAVASGPFITTINDLIAVVTYYGLAWTLLIHTLGL